MFTEGGDHPEKLELKEFTYGRVAKEHTQPLPCHQGQAVPFGIPALPTAPPSASPTPTLPEGPLK